MTAQIISLPTPTTTTVVSDGKAVFEQNHTYVVSWLKNQMKAGEKLLEIYQQMQWREGGYPSFEAYCQALQTEAQTPFGYKRAMQLMGAVQVREDLSTTVDMSLYQSERSLRSLKALPDDMRERVAAAAAREAEQRGESVSSRIVEDVHADVLALESRGLTSLQELIQRLVPWGTLKAIIRVSRTDRKYRYCFERPYRVNTSAFTKVFQTLQEAMVFLDGFCTPEHRLDFVGNDEVRSQPSPTESSQAQAEAAPDLPIYLPASDPDTIEEGLRQGWIVPSTPVAPQPHPAGIMASGAKSGTGTDEHYSPEITWRPALDAWELEAFDLDPATTDNSPIPARHRFTVERCGLSNDWAVNGGSPINIWMNPPYSLNSTPGAFVDKLLAAWNSGLVNNAWVLEKTDNGCEWYQKLLENCVSFCLISKRIKHETPEGGQSGGFFSSTLFYFGCDPEVFFEAYSSLGQVCQVTERGWYGQ